VSDDAAKAIDGLGDTCIVCVLDQKLAEGSPPKLAIVAAMNFSAVSAKTGIALPVCPACATLAAKHLEVWLGVEEEGRKEEVH